MARETYRYYAYSPDMGRRRIPTPVNTPAHWNEERDAVDWAAVRGAVNVVREDGPASKPTGVTPIWHRDAKSAYDIQLAIGDVLIARFPHATVREIGETTAALLTLFNKER